MRKTIPLMDGWLFCGPDGKQTEINLPHTWNAVDGQDGGNDYYRGSCEYQKNFPKPDFYDGQQIYLQFQGVNATATVILNQKQLCVHNNGYSTFRINITEYLQDENNLVVIADNSKNDTVYPQVADFTFYGGIYRDVDLVIVPQYHFDMDYYGSDGIKVTTDVIDTKGIITVESFTNTDNSAGFTIHCMLKDADGEIVAQGYGEKTHLEIENVHLWNGVKDPYLYTLVVTLEKEAVVLDTVECKVGVRTVHIDADKGFFLNGKPYPMRGVSRHQDFKAIGNAISKHHMENDMAMILEMGATTIRLAHYQHSQYFYDLCDRYGLLVWAEIPYISAHMPAGRENTFFQMKELIVQNYNHPCIFTWGISNEITISSKHREDMLDNHNALNRFVKEMDPHRPTTLACYAMCHPFHPVSKITDTVAWNLYLGWYAPGLFLNDLFMDFYHWKYPHRPLGYSEYGAEGMPNLHSPKPKRGDHTEEYQAKYHEYMLECFERHPFLWCTYVWNMFDFAADARDQGGEAGMNHKGLVTFDRKIKKDSFYIYKAWWSDEKFVHLCGKRYQYRTEQISNITVYSNLEQVSLYNNGEFIETQKGKHAFHFKLKLSDTNNIEVVAGDCRDSAVIYKTDKPRPEYKVKKGKSQNWV